MTPKTATHSKERSSNYYRQVLGSIAFKILAIGLSFLLVPQIINYVGVARYGIWSTMTALLNWIVFFDLGLGNGLRNRLAQALAKGDRKQGHIVISTGYLAIGSISLFAFLALSSILPLVRWQAVFNTTVVGERELRLAILAIGFFICLNFLLSLVRNVLNAAQITSLTVLNQVQVNFLALCFVWLSQRLLDPNLAWLALAYGSALVLASFTLNLWYFRRNPDLAPSLRGFRKTEVRGLTDLGFRFFIIQIAVLILFTTDKIIITQLFGPAAVTGYDVAYKLFGLVAIAQSIILGPLWSAYTEAHEMGDMEWIRSTLKKMNFLVLPLVPAILSLVLLGPWVIRAWIGRELGVNALLLWTMGLFAFVRAWNDIYAVLLNGLGQINLQMKIAVVQSLMNIPLSIFLGKFIGVSGVLLATVISLSIFAVAGPLQTYRLLQEEKLP